MAGDGDVMRLCDAGIVPRVIVDARVEPDRLALIDHVAMKLQVAALFD